MLQFWEISHVRGRCLGINWVKAFAGAELSILYIDSLQASFPSDTMEEGTKVEPKFNCVNGVGPTRRTRTAVQHAIVQEVI